ncbi:MAG: hypothetical protein LJE85_06455 [Gammaproteobacteria bacterium]|nr:hypothetical protein [Gammaproteobacteria bacterium]
MSVYDVDKLMLEARKLAAQFRVATGKPLGISSEIAVHDVIRLMNLTPVETNQAGYDAIGNGSRQGRRIQIKGRTISEDAKSNQRIGQIKMEQEWDSVMLVLMDEQYEPLEIYEAQREQILEAVANTSAKRRNRGALSVAKFKYIGTLVWSAQSQQVG